MWLGFFVLFLCAAFFGLAIHLAWVQQHGLAIRYMAPDERKAIEDELHEEEHALRALFDIKHPIRDPGPDVKWP